LTETINIKQLAEDVSTVKKLLETMQPAQPGPKGHVEEGIGMQGVDAKAKLRQAFKEYLKSDVKTPWHAEEAIGAVSAGSAIPSIWSASPELLSPLGADGYFLTGIVKWKEDVKGKPGQTVYVQTVAPVTAFTMVSGTEGTATAATITSVPIVLTQGAHMFYISKTDLEDVEDGTLDTLIQQSKNAIMRQVDAYILQAVQAVSTNVGAGTITEGGKLAATCLAKLWGSIKAGSYQPAAFICHPVPYASLLADTQFTNAATRGKSSIIETGEIGNYLGMDIIPLTQGTLTNGTFTPGTYKAFMMAQGAIVGAIKREMDVEKEYYVKDQRNYSAVTIRYGGTVVHTSGIGELLTVSG
jgi:hypothetical protein